MPVRDDGYVYVYSHDSDSAYAPADRVTLARAPKHRLRGRDAYEFYTGTAQNGESRWSPEIGDAAPPSRIRASATASPSATMPA